MKIIFLGLLLFFVNIIDAHKQAIDNNWIAVHKSTIEKIFNSASEQFPDEGVVKISIARTDIHVTIEDCHLDPFMGLTSWIGFQKGTKKGIEAMIMGDLVLLEHEVNPVLSIALDNGIEITALHNHFFFDNPKVYFMHIGGEGNTKDLARAVKKMMDTVKNVEKEKNISSTKTGSLAVQNSIIAEPIEEILHVKGQTKNGMLKVVFGRTTTAGCGCIVGKNMGINTWAAFGGTNDNAIVDGDFVVLEHELQNVLKTLRDANINIVAIHNHMINERPRMIFLHYWATGKAVDLAQGLKKALDKTVPSSSFNNKKSCCTKQVGF